MFSEEQQEDIRKRFHLRDGQFFGQNRHKNLHWYLGEHRFGFGDLRDSDILIIRAALEPGEVFYGYNASHMGPWMQQENPVIMINVNEVTRPEHVPVSDKTYREIKERYGR